MSVLINKNTRLLVQGITGNEGLVHTTQMVAYGTNVVAGVTPGKGGEWVMDGKIPVFDSVKIAVEAGIRMGWDRFIGADGTFIGMTGFGASGPYKELYEHFGITVDAVVEAARELLGARRGEADDPQAEGAGQE